MTEQPAPEWVDEWVERWLALVGEDPRGAGRSRDELLRSAGQVCRGTVKFYKDEKGWGGIESDEAPFDVWVHFSVIDDTGYKSLVEGELVEFRWEPAAQDSWLCSASWVRKLADGRLS